MCIRGKCEIQTLNSFDRRSIYFHHQTLVDRTWNKGKPVNNSASFFNIIVFDKHCPCNKFHVSIHHFERFSRSSLTKYTNLHCFFLLNRVNSGLLEFLLTTMFLRGSATKTDFSLLSSQEVITISKSNLLDMNRKVSNKIDRI